MAGEAFDCLLTTAEAAKRLNVSESFLAKERVKGTGCRFRKLGRAVRYRLSDIENYLRSRARTSTSEH
jgi:excisionase family DNA binding protein